MTRNTLTALLLTLALHSPKAHASGWPEAYEGVMLQGFYWDSYDQTQWATLAQQAAELGQYFSLLWVPNSANCNNSSDNMGYMPYYYFDHTSSFGTEAQLRSMIAAMGEAGVGVIADVVVNHRNTSGWFTFPAETYGGATYQMLPTDICADDDAGATATQAALEGVSLSANADEGDDWSGCRDLDHQSANVRATVGAYVRFLAQDLGYAGFRYDMVKGYAAEHVAAYNDAAEVEFSVGEYWDGIAPTKTWIDATGKKSAAFDFQFRYNVRDAINYSDWTRLNSTNNLITDEAYRPLAVTFIENHDTERRSSDEQDPIVRDTLAANAYLLSMPGTPCVFLTHWIDLKQDIKAMIDVRHAAGINSQSSWTVMSGNSKTSYAVQVTGSRCGLITVVGSAERLVSTAWTKVNEGYHFAQYLPKTAEIAWANKASGTVDAGTEVTLTAVSQKSETLVYTLDGSEPSASNGTQVSTGFALAISEPCTLKVGLLVGGEVTDVCTRTYDIAEQEAYEPTEITVYVSVAEAGSKWDVGYLNFWTWGGDGTHAPTNTSWPGDRVSTVATSGGQTWYTRTYTLNSSDDYVSFVFSVGSGSPQTVDVARIRQTSYLSVQPTLSSGNYEVVDLTDQYSLIEAPRLAETIGGLYLIDGRALGKAPKRGLYIKDGRKYIAR